MRRLLVGTLVMSFALAVTAGCGSNSSTSTPKTIEPSKEGPVPVGGMPKGGKGSGGTPGSSNQ
jgi:hypothetical protein